MIPQNTWKIVCERNGVPFYQAEGQLNIDPFLTLAQEAASAKAGGFDPARISVTVTSGVDYGQVKVTVTTAISCVQTEARMQAATESGFLKTLEMVNEACDALRIPRLPVTY